MKKTTYIALSGYSSGVETDWLIFFLFALVLAGRKVDTDVRSPGHWPGVHTDWCPTVVEDNRDLQGATAIFRHTTPVANKGIQMCVQMEIIMRNMTCQCHNFVSSCSSIISVST